jgi:hypothetical protein
VVEDRSGMGNDVYADSLFHRLADGPPPGATIWVPHGASGYAFVGGKEGGGALTALDSYSLNSPALTNQLTLQAEVNIPVQPVGWASGIVGKEAYELTLDKEGKACFKLCLKGQGPRQQMVLVTPTPLMAGAWHKLVGTFDGAVMRFLVDGQVVAEQATEPGARLCACSTSLCVNRQGWYPKIGGDEERKAFLIDNVIVSNQVPPTV